MVSREKTDARISLKLLDLFTFAESIFGISHLIHLS
jgi:hypothetical protein